MEKFQNNILFRGFTLEEVQQYIAFSGGKIHVLPKDKIIFRQMETPKSLYVLLKGSVLVCKDSPDGKRYIVSKIQAGDIFGEVFIFAGIPYDFYTVTHKASEILEIPEHFFRDASCLVHPVHQKVMYNMLRILGRKAYTLNKRVQLLTSGTLRQKIIKLILEKSQNQTYVKFDMNREMMADFLNVTRPSLSRELTNMQKDGLIEFEQDMVKILDVKKMQWVLQDSGC